MDRRYSQCPISDWGWNIRHRVRMLWSIQGELILLDSKNGNIEYSQYDHIVESGLNLKSGILQVLDCPNSNVELEIKVNPGKYRVRIYSLNLNSVVGDSGDDYYKIEIWPDVNMERIVLKQYLTR